MSSKRQAGNSYLLLNKKNHTTLRQLPQTSQIKMNGILLAKRLGSMHTETTFTKSQPPPRVNRIGVCIAPKLAAKSDSIDIRHRQCLIITLWLRFSDGRRDATRRPRKQLTPPLPLVWRRVKKARKEDESETPTRTNERTNELNNEA